MVTEAEDADLLRYNEVTYVSHDEQRFAIVSVSSSSVGRHVLLLFFVGEVGEHVFAAPILLNKSNMPDKLFSTRAR